MRLKMDAAVCHSLLGVVCDVVGVPEMLVLYLKPYSLLACLHIAVSKTSALSVVTSGLVPCYLLGGND